MDFKFLKEVIEYVYSMDYSRDDPSNLEKCSKNIRQLIITSHFLRSNLYLDSLSKIDQDIAELSTYKSRNDKLLQRNIQRSIANLAKQIIEENKKIFIVHGRNIAMRDSVSSLLGRLKLDYVILESEINMGVL